MSAEPSLFVGTSGYSFADWVGPFYPVGTKSGDYLRHYATQFGTVEVNSTYYRIPQARGIAQMEAKTPDGFRFIVKLNQAMTHESGAGPELYREFLAAVQPLKDVGKYHGLLAQFPWGFKKTEENKRHLEVMRERLEGEPLWAEFRHASWMHPKLPEWLRERALGYCAVDEPALQGLVPPVTHVTNDIGYVRFHGRNEQTWWGRGGGDRYEYNYSQPQLEEWVQRIESMARQAKQTYLFFNNCHAGQAAGNAKLMEELLKRQGLLA